MTDFDVEGFIKAFVDYLDKASKNANASPEEKPDAELAEKLALENLKAMSEGMVDALGAFLVVLQDNIQEAIDKLKKKG